MRDVPPRLRVHPHNNAAEIAVVVLNWNRANDTIDCLESLRKSSVPLHTIVVDNGSTDNSVELVTASGLANSVIGLRANLGYAEGNNVGLQTAIDRQFPIIAVMNNDVVVQAQSLEILSSYVFSSEHRALSPVIRYFDDPARSWFAGGTVDRGWPRHLQPHELPTDDGPLRPTECLSGCCIIASRETWVRVGLFDPRYFLIFEDSDWSLRAISSGVKLYVAIDSLIEHKVSRSFQSGPSSLLSNFYFVRNGLRFEAAHAARYLPVFALRWLIRPSASALLHRRNGRSTLLRWLGALAFLSRQRGRAPGVVERLARGLSRSER